MHRQSLFFRHACNQVHNHSLLLMFVTGIEKSLAIVRRKQMLVALSLSGIPIDVEKIPYQLPLALLLRSRRTPRAAQQWNRNASKHDVTGALR